MITTAGLSYQYKSGQLLSFKDLSISKKDHVLIIGRSGCGKTTLLHLLSGLRRPDSGQVVIMDQDISSMEVSKVDRFRGNHIGMIFQVPHFIRSLTVLENLILAQSLAGSNMDRAHCRSLLEELNIGEKADKHTDELSVGEQQRVAIARALVNRPEIIFADEPTSALDDENTEKVIQLLKRQAEHHGATLIVVTHDQRLKDNFKHHIAL